MAQHSGSFLGFLVGSHFSQESELVLVLNPGLLNSKLEQDSWIFIPRKWIMEGWLFLQAFLAHLCRSWAVAPGCPHGGTMLTTDLTCPDFSVPHHFS